MLRCSLCLHSNYFSKMRNGKTYGYATGTDFMTPRLRRLTADQTAIVAAFAGHPSIEVTPIGPAPVDHYRITYRVPALRKSATNELEPVNLVVVEMTLPTGYPRDKPYCTTETRIFHPNFGNYICIADFWSPSNSIVDVIVEIGDMLQYKVYNTQSPLNALAARWVVEHVDRIPLGNIQLIPIEPEIAFGRFSLASSDDGTTEVAPTRLESKKKSKSSEGDESER